MNSPIAAGWTMCLATCLLACAPRVAPSGPMVIEDQEQSFEPAEVAVERVRTGSMARASLHITLDAGVGAFLTNLEVSPHLVDGRFAGWTIESYRNHWVDLLPGDVVTVVNARSIETPAQVQALWESLRAADEIVVSVARGELTFDLRFAIQGEMSAE